MGPTGQNTLVEHWNGSGWTIQTSPNPAGETNLLRSVTCTTTTSCFAVGQNQNGTTEQGLVEHWNGTVWSVVTSPDPAGAIFTVPLGVLCATPTSCFAVGYWNTSTPVNPLVEHWNGTAWLLVTVPTPAGATKTRFGGVSCPTATSCFAAGSAENDSAAGHPQSTLIEHWNGTVWSIATSPNVSGVSSSSFGGITCPSATACFAVGASSRVTGIVGDTNPLIERWSGSSWSIVASPNPVASHGSALGAVACPISTHCFAIGGSEISDLTLTEVWNGSTWSLAAPPTGSSQSQLLGVSCLVATNCYTVGFNETAAGYRTLVEHLSGSTWSIETSANVTGASDDFLSGVACATATSCFAVGVSDTGVTPAMLVEHWNGSAWSVVTLPKPANSSQTHLDAVACSSDKNCFAVGSYETSVGSTSVIKSLIERWNGTSWSVQTNPVKSTATETDLAGISCATATSCFAVGTYFTTSAEGTFVSRWNGSTWSIVASPNPAEADNTHPLLDSVSCATASSCFAVGSSNPTAPTAKTLVERWNGTVWTIVTSPNSTGGLTELLGVSCATSASCFAVGHDHTSTTSPNFKTIVEHWNGTAWSLVASPNRAGAVESNVVAVACSSATLCRAVGFSAGTGNLHTLIEQYA